MGAFRKDQEVLQISFQGDGPIGTIMTIADTKGNVKGKVCAVSMWCTPNVVHHEGWWCFTILLGLLDWDR
jgi:redox-regulated HSP33 family molecular chaperone